MFRAMSLAALTLLPAAALAAEDAASLRLVPFPKEVRLESGTFSLDRPLVVEAPPEVLAQVGEAFGAECRRAGLRAPQLKPAAGTGNALRLAPSAGAKMPAVAFRQGAGEEDYALDIRSGAAVVTGHGPAGLFYGVQTLCQLVRANRRGKGLPCLTVRDWPSLRWRAFQDDLTRGPSSTLEELKREAALGATLKMNVFTYYMEHQFAFKKHPEIGPPDGSLTPEDLRSLVEFCRPLHTDVLGNQQSFGHFYNILKHDAYKPLGENAWILSPVNEGSYQLLDDLYSEVIPRLPGPFFNVCCDETQGLGEGASKELAKQIGVGGVYARHIRRVHDLVHGKYGKRMMMWGDIILGHPDNLKEIPKDTVMLTWGYDPRANFESQILPFARSGYEFFVCPGVNNWSRILPDFGDATTNIGNFTRDGAKHGALGFLNTSWDDDGETLNGPNWHGFAWGAECAWNASATPPDAFNRRIGAVLFGEQGDRFGQAIGLLSGAHRLPGMQGMMDSRFWDLDLGPLKSTIAAARTDAEKLLAIVEPALEHLQACRKEATANAAILDTFLFGARRMELIGRRSLDRLDAAAGYAAAYEQGVDAAAAAKAGPLLARAEATFRKNGDAHEALGREFVALWQRENRPFAMEAPVKRYANATAAYAALADRIAAARKAIEAGKPMPSPKEVGLDLVELGTRRTRPGKIVAAPLQPDLPWAEPAATHRLGLAVSAGPADRADLPVEVDLRLPAGVAGRRVRAFCLAADGKAQEILAQLDPTEDGEKSRLTLLLDAPLAKGTTATVHVYLGAPAAAPTLPGAVKTTDAPKEMKWIENDKLRLLLGPEGAHLYRWEVKALQNRDLTMPGEAEYFGFADVGGAHRSPKNALKCTARGPALVRYVCTDDAGLVKTVSLFGGAAWVEVLLSAPMSYFFAFDDPGILAPDGPTPGTYLFSNGNTGAVGKVSDAQEAQKKANGVFWGVKFAAGGPALGLVTPDVAALHVVGPGSGWGGVGIENGPGATHFVLYGGVPAIEPAALMRRLHQTLDFRSQPEVTLHALQAR